MANTVMAKTVPLIGMIGIDPSELGSIRLLVLLLRHPDPMIAELTRLALRHVEEVAARQAVKQPDSLDHTG